MSAASRWLVSEAARAALLYIDANLRQIPACELNFSLELIASFKGKANLSKVAISQRRAVLSFKCKSFLSIVSLSVFYVNDIMPFCFLCQWPPQSAASLAPHRRIKHHIRHLRHQKLHSAYPGFHRRAVLPGHSLGRSIVDAFHFIRSSANGASSGRCLNCSQFRWRHAQQPVRRPR